MIAKRVLPRVQAPYICHTCRGISTTILKNGVTLAYDLHEPPNGSPPNAPILFIHGLFGSKKNNRSMSRVFARDLKRPVYAIDLRNHGDASHHPRHDYITLAEDVEGFIDEHGLKNSTLIGHSMGAKTAMTVALRHRAPIANLISVDNAPVDAALSSDFAKYIKGMRQIASLHLTKQSDADEILKEYEDNPAIRLFLLTNLYRDRDDGIQKWRIPVKFLSAALDNMADFPFKDPDEVRWEGPALFVRGTKSKYVADEMLPIVGRFFPMFEVVDIKGGHWLISENPEAFRKAVVEFLQDKE